MISTLILLRRFLPRAYVCVGAFCSDDDFAEQCVVAQIMGVITLFFFTAACWDEMRSLSAIIPRAHSAQNGPLRSEADDYAAVWLGAFFSPLGEGRAGGLDKNAVRKNPKGSNFFI